MQIVNESKMKGLIFNFSRVMRSSLPWLTSPDIPSTQWFLCEHHTQNLIGKLPHLSLREEDLMQPCIRNDSELVYTEGGTLSTFPTFMNCIRNIPSPKLIPSFFNGSISKPLQLQTAIQMNNIGNVRVPVCDDSACSSMSIQSVVCPHSPLHGLYHIEDRS